MPKSPWLAATTSCNSSDIFTAGIITALADHAAGIAITSSLPKGKIGVTVELKVNFSAQPTASS